MSLDLATLRAGDVITGEGSFDGSAIVWKADSLRLKTPSFVTGDPVSWPVAPGRRRYGTVLAIAGARDGTGLLAWIEPLVGAPVTMPAAELTRELRPLREVAEQPCSVV